MLAKDLPWDKHSDRNRRRKRFWLRDERVERNEGASQLTYCASDKWHLHTSRQTGMDTDRQRVYQGGRIRKSLTISCN